MRTYMMQWYNAYIYILYISLYACHRYMLSMAFHLLSIHATCMHISHFKQVAFLTDCGTKFSDVHPFHDLTRCESITQSVKYILWCAWTATSWRMQSKRMALKQRWGSRATLTRQTWFSSITRERSQSTRARRTSCKSLPKCAWKCDLTKMHFKICRLTVGSFDLKKEQWIGVKPRHWGTTCARSISCKSWRWRRHHTSKRFQRFLLWEMYLALEKQIQFRSSLGIARVSLRWSLPRSFMSTIARRPASEHDDPELHSLVYSLNITRILLLLIATYQFYERRI